MSADACKEKGNAEFKNKNFEAAIQHFTEGLQIDPKNHVLFSNRSACYASLAQYEKALEDAQKCVECAPPTWGKAYLRLGAAHFGLEDFPEALAAFKKADELEPSDTAKERIQEVQAAMRSHNPFAKIFGPDTFAKIQLNPKLAPYLLQPDYVQKIQTLVQNPSMMNAFMQDQRIMQTLVELMGINVSQGDAERAPEQRKPEPEPKKSAPPPPAPKEEVHPSVAAKERGNAHYKKREFEEALKCYEEAIELDPKNGTFYLNKSSVFFEMGKFDECLQEVNLALEKFDNKDLVQDFVLKAKLLTRRGQVHQHYKRYPEAIESYQAALRENRNSDTLSKLNACESEKKKWDIESYYDPELGAQAKERGNACFKEQRFPDAIKEYTESIKRHPTDHTVYSNRAAAYMKLGAYDDAVKDCEKCLSMDPGFVKAIVRLAHCYFFRKEYHKALQQYEAGLKLDPTHEECRDGINRTRAKIMESMSSGEVDEERISRARNDPEIREILADTYMQFVLREMSMDPKRADEYMKDASIAQKINKLVMAGVLSFGNGKEEDEGRGRKKR